MLGILLKKQMAEIFRGYFYDAKKNKARSKGSVIAFIILFCLLMVGVVGGMFTFLSISLCGAMAKAGMDWLYFAIMGMLAIFLGIFGSVFNTYAGLYLAKDNDLLLSMPIPVNTIMTARLLGVYLMGLIYSGVVIIPAVAVYFITVSASPLVTIGSLLFIILISLFDLTLSCALGWVVAKISQKLKNRSFITVLVSLLFFAAYYIFYFKIQDIINDLVANAAVYGDAIKEKAYPIYLFGRVSCGDVVAMLIVSAFVLALFAIMWLVISHGFIKIATSSSQIAKKKYRESATKEKSIGMTLLEKEFGRFTSSPNYMLNCGFGIIFMLALGVILLIKGNTIFSQINNELSDFGFKGIISVIVCAAMCAAALMNNMAAPSVSLEGKNLWILQSLPVTQWQILKAKLSVQLILTAVPMAFCIICALVAYPFSAAEVLFVILIPMIQVCLLALFDMVLGLKFPNLTWTNEVTPIKQSACTGLSLLGGFFISILLFVPYFLIGMFIGAEIYMAGVSIVQIIVCILLYSWIKKKGSAIFAAL